MIRSDLIRSIRRHAGARTWLTIVGGRHGARDILRHKGVPESRQIASAFKGTRACAASAPRTKDWRPGENEVLVEHVLEALETSLESLALVQGQIGEKVLTLLQKELDNLDASAAAVKQDDGWDFPPEEAEEVLEPNIDAGHLWVTLQKDPESGFGIDVIRAVLKHAIRLFEERDKSAVTDIEFPEGSLVEDLPSGSLALPEATEKLEHYDKETKLVVVGDTHGQLNDVLWLFHQHGPPSHKTTYVFNGDIADRGKYAVEIFILLLAFKIKYPDRVHLLRGNHEHCAMNNLPMQMGGGFAAECDDKHGKWLYLQFQHLFQLLPLFAVIENQIFVVHAGLPRKQDISLAHMRDINVPIRHYPPTRSKKDILNGETLNWTSEQMIIFDAQWADPHDGKGIQASKRGRDAVNFGEDITQSFLDENKLELCIRSHQVPPRKDKWTRGHGYHWSHGKRLLTVFSASNYGGTSKNNGAVSIFRKGTITAEEEDTYCQIGDFIMSIKEHYAPKDMKQVAKTLGAPNVLHNKSMKKVLGSTKGAQINDEVHPHQEETLMAPAVLSTELMPEGLLSYIIINICAHREALWNFCREHGTGDLVPAKLLEGELAKLVHGPGEDLPWSWLLENVLGDSSYSGYSDMVQYKPFLSRYRIQWKALDTKRKTADSCKHLRDVMFKVLSADLTLTEAKGLFDKNLDGQIDEDECELVLTRLLPALSTRQISLILEALQDAWGGRKTVSAERFLVTLQLHFAFRAPPEDPTLRNALEALVNKMMSNPENEHSTDNLVTSGMKLLDIFRAWDADDSGFLSHDELLEQIQRIVNLSELGLDSEQQESLFQYLDETQNGSLNVFEFLRGFAAVLPVTSTTTSSSASSALADDMFSGLCGVLLAHRSILLRGCRKFDERTPEKGILPRETFLVVVQALLDSLPESYQSWAWGVKLNELRRVLDNEVNYDELLAELEIIDTSRSLQ